MEVARSKKEILDFIFRTNNEERIKLGKSNEKGQGDVHRLGVP